jgi:hypothetical protein
MKRRSGKVSEAMKAAALRVARTAGIKPLEPGQARPPYFYVINHFTGQPVVRDRNAVVPKRSD